MFFSYIKFYLHLIEILPFKLEKESLEFKTIIKYLIIKYNN